MRISDWSSDVCSSDLWWQKAMSSSSGVWCATACMRCYERTLCLGRCEQLFLFCRGCFCTRTQRRSLGRFIKQRWVRGQSLSRSEGPSDSEDGHTLAQIGREHV